MSNFQVYKKTISFSLIGFLVDIIALIIVVGACTGGFFLMDKSTDKALIGLGVGLIIGIVISILIKIFISNRIKAAQIGMMAIGVVDGKLPDNVISAGFQEVRGRFAKITLFFMVTGAIKGIFRQLGRAINKLGTAVGGDVGNGITSAIDGAIQTVIGYLCDCCLGWVMYNKNKGVAEAACEGAVIFFKNGKALIRNIGRIFGMGLLSFAIIGGGFFGLSYLISSQFPQMFQTLSKEIIEFGTRNEIEIPEFVSNTTTLMLFVSAVIGIVIWSMLHSLLIRPFILVGVLRNFMNAGFKQKVTEDDFRTLDDKSPKFAKLRRSI